ncbi:hypothetical protein, partial [Pseudomonas sp. SIMBA_068]|uniref:hypothetical protein n=1 Tax=Pseudomonas sp. SIMBA_068 TaxID=3085808 RepID=UPI00397D76C8
GSGLQPINVIHIQKIVGLEPLAASGQPDLDFAGLYQETQRFAVRVLGVQVSRGQQALFFCLYLGYCLFQPGGQ